MELFFPDWSQREFIQDDFDGLIYDRKTQGYKEVMQLARLILLQLNPQIQSGSNQVIAIFFDMNNLFERYVAKVLRKRLSSHQYLKEQGPQRDLLIKKELNEIVQKSFRLKPDMVVGEGSPSQGIHQAILDTKWKSLVDSNKKMGVSESDLYQLYTYAGEYQCPSVALIYPKWGIDAEPYSYEYQVGPNQDLKTTIRLIPYDCETDEMDIEFLKTSKQVEIPNSN